MKLFIESDPSIAIQMMHEGHRNFGNYNLTDAMISASPKLKEMVSVNHDAVFTMRYSEFNQVCKVLEMTSAGQRQMSFNPTFDPAHQMFVNPYSITVSFNGTGYQMTPASSWFWSPFLDYRG